MVIPMKLAPASLSLSSLFLDNKNPGWIKILLIAITIHYFKIIVVNSFTSPISFV